MWTGLVVSCVVEMNKIFLPATSMIDHLNVLPPYCQWDAGGATTLRTATLAMVHSTAEYCAGAIVLTPASLTLSSTKLCDLWLDACVLHQRTIFLSSQASNLLSYVAKEPHCLQHSVPWSLGICSTQSAHLSIEWKCTASQIETPICARCTTTR